MALVFGGAFIVYTTGILEPVFSPLGTGLGFRTSTSTPSNVSQYEGEVEIRFLSLGGGLDQPMVVSLKGANSSSHPGIILTGWTLRTNEGTYAIPKVANLYSPSVPGVPPEDIYLRSGGTVNFYSDRNPQGNQQAIRSGEAEWQIWLGKDFLTVPHGAVILRDGAGKVVDEYRY